MVMDWLRCNETFVARINKINNKKGTASIKLGFYKNIAALSCKSFKLTKIKKKAGEYEFSSRSENVEVCTNGNEVFYEELFDSDNYLIKNDSGDELGELGANAVKFISENEDNIKFLRINNIEETESGGYTADIEVFYSK